METLDIFPGYEVYVSDIDDGDFRRKDLYPEFLRPEKQLHETLVHTVTSTDKYLPFAGVDGVYTKEKDIAIGSLCADCPVIVLMGESECASLHSGWRGSKKHILYEGLKYFHTPRDRIRAYIGPHIRRESYEVQEDFLSHFPPEYIEKRNDKLYFDITTYLLDDIISTGIQKENITISPIDTYQNRAYHSYRRDGMIGLSFVGVKILV